LSRRPRSIPPKYFYDAAGSELFDRICALPEYYPTRTELGILRAHATDIVRRVGPHAAARPCRPAVAPAAQHPAEILLRCGGLRAVRPHLRAAGVLPDAHRARHPA
ncbi:L-histidine N(alpha)-methyltransferase, partial [Paraburkholderia sp. Se-20369]|nr:L-histidine N(alpha)-methyltransferase [Paraburkholderia sp. Se-20369]